jgi:hypothetical protein
LDVFVSAHDAEKRQFADELIAYADAFMKTLYIPLIDHTDMLEEFDRFIKFD